MDSLIKRIISKLPFIATVPIIFIIVYCAWYLSRTPFDGMDWSPVDGFIQSVDSSGPAYGIIEPEDIILSIDGIPPSLTRSIYATKNASDSIKITIQRGEEILDHELILTTPTRSELIHRFMPIIVALSFALIGILILSFTPSSISNNLFSLLCFCVSGILASGSISARGPEWVSVIFNVLLWWVGPLTVHFHMHFPEPRSAPRRIVIHAILYFIALLGSLPYIIIGSAQLQASPLNRAIYTAGRFNLAINLVIVVVLLIFSYIYATEGRTRQQIRMITFFGGLSLLTVVTLSLLPSALMFKPLVPYEISFLFLLLIPISYGYSILRYRLIEFEKILNRGAAFVLVFTVLIGLYLLIIATIERFVPVPLHENPLVSLAIFLPLAISFETLRRPIQYFVDWVFYGGWYDYRSATSNITEGCGQIVDANLLGKTIIERLKNTLRLEYAYLLRISSQGYVFPIPNSGGFPHNLPSSIYNHNHPNLPKSGVLHPYFLSKQQVVEARELGRIFKEKTVSEAELDLIDALQGTWITPILANELLLGLLVLGPKSGREVFSSEDYDILTVVSRHAGIALHNIQLLNELRHRAANIKQLHQEILRAREEERKRLSLELHDEIIQSLVSLNFDLGNLDSEQVPKLRSDVRQIVGGLRQICSELRPPTLDNLGLVPAIRSLLRNLETINRDPPMIQFKVEGDENIRIPEDIALNIYRVLAESLNNTFRHANAQNLEIQIKLLPEKVSFEVKDDGCGFTIPRPLGKMLADQHFGLVGMRERIEHFNGVLSIDSYPGKGTRIIVSIPLDEHQYVNISERL